MKNHILRETSGSVQDCRLAAPLIAATRVGVTDS
jgi:hypothetical protein